MESQPIPPPTAPWEPSLVGGAAALLGGGLGTLPLHFLGTTPIGGMLSLGLVVLWAAIFAIFIYYQWSRPLVSIIRLGLSEETASPSGASLVRSVHYAVISGQQSLKDGTEQLRLEWQEGVAAAVQGGLGPDVVPEVREAIELLLEAFAQRFVLVRQDIHRMILAYESARTTARDLKQYVRDAERCWGEISDEARRAEAGLASIEPELVARCAREHERMVAFDTAMASFQDGVGALAQKAQDLAEQAHRATDVAARDLAREARIARGERAAPVEAPPLDTWAADLDATARELAALVSEMQRVPRLEAAHWAPLNEEALVAMVASGKSAATAVESSGALIRAVGRWAEAHENDLRPSWGRIKRLVNNDSIDALEVSGPPLDRLVAELDSAAEAAHTRINAAVDRTLRLLRATRTSVSN